MDNRPKIPFYYDYVMPNICVPNATPPAMGIINYIHTMYSNRLHQQSLFDTDLGSPHGPIESIFGKEYGHMPNSFWNNGSYLAQHCFSTHVDVWSNAVYFGKQTYKKYVYPIKVNYNFGDFTCVDRKKYFRLEGDYFWKFISKEALDDIKSKQAVILLEYCNENFIEKEEYENFHKSLAMSGIPKSQIILTINSFNAPQLYNQWFDENQQQLEVINFPYLLYCTSYNYSTNQSGLVKPIIFKSTYHKKRKYYFTYKIRRAREHRINLLFKLAQDNLLEKADWSMLDVDSYNRGVNLHRFNFNFDESIINQTVAKFPKHLDSEPNADVNNTHGWSDNDHVPYIDSYFYLCTETYYHPPYKSFTEKIFKPLANFKPIIFYGFQGAMQVLKDLGFKTFHPFIDESYDNEPDEVKRMHMVCDEIKKLCNMTPEEIHTWYWQMEDIYWHNRKVILEYHRDPKFIKPLVDLLKQKVS